MNKELQKQKKTAETIHCHSHITLPRKNWQCCLAGSQRYTDRVLQTIQMKLILLWVWAERAVLGRAKTALKFKYEI